MKSLDGFIAFILAVIDRVYNFFFHQISLKFIVAKKLYHNRRWGISIECGEGGVKKPRNLLVVIIGRPLWKYVYSLGTLKKRLPPPPPIKLTLLLISV